MFFTSQELPLKLEHFIERFARRNGVQVLLGKRELIQKVHKSSAEPGGLNRRSKNDRIILLNEMFAEEMHLIKYSLLEDSITIWNN